MLSQIKSHNFQKTKTDFFPEIFGFRENLPSLKPTTNSPPFAGDQRPTLAGLVWNGRNCSKVLKFMPLEGNLQVVQGGIPYLFPEEMAPPRNGDEWHGIHLTHMVA